MAHALAPTDGILLLLLSGIANNAQSIAHHVWMQILAPIVKLTSPSLPELALAHLETSSTTLIVCLVLTVAPVAVTMQAV